jgi:hypothetical protein
VDKEVYGTYAWLLAPGQIKYRPVVINIYSVGVAYYFDVCSAYYLQNYPLSWWRKVWNRIR